jgi:hypothetical protein
MVAQQRMRGDGGINAGALAGHHGATKSIMA